MFEELRKWTDDELKQELAERDAERREEVIVLPMGDSQIDYFVSWQTKALPYGRPIESMTRMLFVHDELGKNPLVVELARVGGAGVLAPYAYILPRQVKKIAEAMLLFIK